MATYRGIRGSLNEYGCGIGQAACREGGYFNPGLKPNRYSTWGAVASNVGPVQGVRSNRNRNLTGSLGAETGGMVKAFKAGVAATVALVYRVHQPRAKIRASLFRCRN